MFDQINTLLGKVFSNEESIIFSFLIFAFLLVLYFFGSLLTPFIVSIIFAYLLIGLTKNLIKYGMREFTSLVISYVIFLVGGLSFLVWLIPLIFQQTQAFFIEVPLWLNNFRSYIENLMQSNQDLISSEQISAFFTELVTRLSSISQGVLDASISGIQDTVIFSIYLIMIPVLVFFFLFDKDRIINGFLMFLAKKREMLSDVWLEMDEQLSNYVWGKGVEILIVGFSAAIIFGIMGLNYTALLSIIVGFSVLIPYVGAFLATIPVVVVALLQFGIGFDFYMIVGLYLLLQALDGNVLVPVLFSDAVKLHPVVIMLAVFIRCNNIF